MKRLLLGLCIALGVFLITPPPTADALGRDWSGYWEKNKNKRRHVVPEFDPNAAGSAIVLLLGGAALVLSRRREDETT